MSYKIAVLPGDGIGPEVMREGTQVLNQAAKLHGFKVELEEGVVAARRSTPMASRTRIPF